MIYKFRGKTKNGKWLYGSLMNWKSGPSILTETEPDVVSQEPVLTDTVGQFTGLHEKNGKAIYEGDIVSFREFDHRGVIQFAYGVFGINFDYANSQNPLNKEGKLYGAWGQNHNLRKIDDDEMLSEIIKIGNIHDNPELMPVST